MATLSISNRKERHLGGAAQWLAAGTAILVLLAAALWNGFPLIYPDTGGYLARPLTGTLELGRSALYGAFLLAGAPLAFWPNLVAQAALMVWLIGRTLRVSGLGRRPWLAPGVVAALSLTTSLPWFTSQMMPDILFPAGVLALYLLAFAQSNIVERVALCAVIVFAIVSHIAFLALALGLIAALLVTGLSKNFPTPRLVLPAIALACGLLLAPLSNLLIAGQFAFTPGGASFLFGRLVEDGIVTRYLDDKCPDATLRICAYRGEISRGYDDWLWANDSPFWKLGGWKEFSGEQRRIILATLAHDPLAHLATAAANSAEQFLSFATEVATDRDDNSHTTDTFRDRLPALLPPLLAARQQTGGLDVTPLNVIHVPVGALSMIGLAGALIFRRRLGLPPPAVTLAATVLLALAVNAVVCGVFSHPADRYQSRLILLAPLALMICAAGRRRAA